QAEDGIRDLIVTGVQTCALPISTLSSSPTVPAKAAASIHFFAAPQVGLGLACSTGAFSPSGNPLGRRTHGITKTSKNGVKLAIEIGRASCRERVEIAEGEGSGKK